MKHFKLLTLILSAFTFITLQVTAQTTGKLALQKGQKIQMNNTMNSVTTMELMGQSMEITSDAYMENRVEIKDKKAASYVVGSTFTKMTINGSAMGQTFTFDSDKKEDRENNEIGKKISGILDKEMQMEIKEDGSVVEGSIDTAAKSEAAEAMGSLTGGGDFSKLAGEAFVALPAGVKTGYTWSDSLVLDGVKMNRNYNITEINNKIATVALTGTQNTSKTVQQMGTEVQVNLTSKLTGQFKVDTSTGIVLERTLVSDGSGTADAMGQSIPISTKVTANSISKAL